METTGIVVITFIIILGIYDAIVVMRSGVGTSVSRFLQRTSLKSPVFSIVIGFVAGHIWGYMAPECPVPVAPKCVEVGK